MQRVRTGPQSARSICLAALATILLGAPTRDVYAQSSTDPDHSDMAPGAAAEPHAATVAAKGAGWERLTGGWLGLRPWLGAHGVTIDPRYTASYQGLTSGTGDQAFEYGGKADALIGLDTGRMGLWSGGGFHTHLEYRHGDAPANRGGALFSVNAAQLWPVQAPEQVEATSLYLTQRWGDRVDVALGKFNPVDLLAADPLFGGWGIDRFMNLIVVAPPSGLVPPVFIGAVANIRTSAIGWNVAVFDPDDRTTDYFPGDLFANGVNISVTGAHADTLAGRRTTYAATASYSTAEGTDYSALPPGITTSTKQGSYNLTFQFSHDLQESAGQGQPGWGLYVRAAIADGNPNYVEASVIAGIAGRPRFLGRPRDRFGVAAFYYNLSDELQDMSHPDAELGDEAALEAYYSVTVTRWLDVAADVQYINPARGGYRQALVAALRTSVRF